MISGKLLLQYIIGWIGAGHNGYNWFILFEIIITVEIAFR